MLKVTSSLYTWIYSCFDTLRTMQYFSWGERSTHFAAPCMIFFFSFLFGCNFSILFFFFFLKPWIWMQKSYKLNFYIMWWNEQCWVGYTIYYIKTFLWRAQVETLEHNSQISGWLDVGYALIMNKLDISWNSTHIESSWALPFFVRVYLCLNS